MKYISLFLLTTMFSQFCMAGDLSVTCKKGEEEITIHISESNVFSLSGGEFTYPEEKLAVVNFEGLSNANTNDGEKSFMFFKGDYTSYPDEHVNHLEIVRNQQGSITVIQATVELYNGIPISYIFGVSDCDQPELKKFEGRLKDIEGSLG